MTGTVTGGGGSVGTLQVSGGGGASVETDELGALAELLRTVETETEHAVSRLSTLEVVTDEALSSRAPEAQAAVVAAIGGLGEVKESAGRLSLGVRVAAEAYGAAERTILDAGEFAAGQVGYTIGRLAPLLGLAAAPAAMGAAISVALGLAVVPGGPKNLNDLAGWIGKHPELLNNPLTAGAIRLLMTSSDEIVAGAAGLPRGFTEQPGGSGPGPFGFGIQQAAAAVLAGAAGLGGLTGGALVETPVTVRPVSSSSAAPPAGLADLVERMPSTTDGGPQIRLEKYPGAGGQSKWIVYLGGTVGLGLQPEGEPFDMTSNIQSMAGLDAGSYRAATQAMAEAGVSPTDPVLVAGYSQGGLLAVELERSGDYNVEGVLTLGSPVGQIETTAPTASLAHTEDVIPALGGVDSATADDRIVVQRSLYDTAPVPADQGGIPAHSLTEYQTTASLMDASDDPRIVAYREQIAQFLGGSEGTSTLIRADRLPALPVPAD